jgi:hypothetical protein
MHKLLGLNKEDLTTNGLDFNPYTDISGSLRESDGYWNGIENSFPQESSIGKILIDETIDTTYFPGLRESCIVEMNCGEALNGAITNTAGYESVGVLIGDYKVKKTNKGKDMTRARYIKLPVVDEIEGAF